MESWCGFSILNHVSNELRLALEVQNNTEKTVHWQCVFHCFRNPKISLVLFDGCQLWFTVGIHLRLWMTLGIKNSAELNRPPWESEITGLFRKNFSKLGLLSEVNFTWIMESFNLLFRLNLRMTWFPSPINRFIHCLIPFRVHYISLIQTKRCSKSHRTILYTHAQSCSVEIIENKPQRTDIIGDKVVLRISSLYFWVIMPTIWASDCLIPVSIRRWYLAYGMAESWEY